MSRIYAVIPARYASTRLPGKPLIRIAGKPMIQWVYERTRRVKAFTDVLVATDDHRIADCVRGFGGKAVLTDPALPSGTDRMAAALRGIGFDWAMNVQGDEPLIPPALLRAILARAARLKGPAIVTAAEKMADPGSALDPNQVKVVLTEKGRALYFSRSPVPYAGRAEAPAKVPFFKHLGIYCFHRNALALFVQRKPSMLEKIERLEQLRAFELGIPIEVVLTHYHPVNVDVPMDVELAAKALKRERS